MDQPAPPSHPPRRRLRSWAINSALLIGTVLVTLLLAEVSVRLLSPQQLIVKRPDVWVAVDTLGWVQRSNVHTTVNLGERTVTLVTDSQGFRIGTKPRPVGGKKILMLGDSFMEALQVEYEQSLPGLIEDSLPALVGEPVEVRNTAVGGWDPDQYYLQARRSLSHGHYDLVLATLYLGNDILTDFRAVVPPRTPEDNHHFQWPRQWSLRAIARAWLYPINDFLEVRSHLFILFKKQLPTLLMRLGMSAAYFPDTFLRNQARSSRWHTTAALYGDIFQLAADRGVPALFILLPTPFQVHREAFQQYVVGFGINPDSVDLDQPNRLMKAELDSLSLPYVDVTPNLRLAAQKGEQLYGKVDPHFTPEGHVVAYEAIADRVASLLRPADGSTAR